RGSEPDHVAVAIGDLHLTHAPRHVGRRLLDHGTLARDLVVEPIDAWREDHHPRARVALAALAHEQHGIAATDRTEVRRIAVLPVDLEAEGVAVVALARLETAYVEDRARARQIAVLGAHLGHLDERIAPLGRPPAPHEADRQTDHRTRNCQHHRTH